MTITEITDTGTSQAAIAKLRERGLLDEISQQEIERLGLEHVVKDAFSLKRFSGSSYFVASVVHQLITRYPELASEYETGIHQEALYQINLGGVRLNAESTKKRLVYLQRNGVVKVNNKHIPVKDIDLILTDLLLSHCGQPPYYKKNGVEPKKRVWQQDLLEIGMQEVRYIATSIARRLPQSVELDDLIQAGYIGLLGIIDTYNPQRNIDFRRYIKQRVRGAIIDHIRSEDHLSVSIRRKQKRIKKAREELERERGTYDITDEEVAERAGIKIGEYWAALEIITAKHVELDAVSKRTDKKDYYYLGETIDSGKDTPERQTEQKEELELVAAMTEDLQEDQRRVIELYHFEGYNLKAVGKELNLTESRASQIRMGAIRTLKKRVRLRRWKEEALVR